MKHFASVILMAAWPVAGFAQPGDPTLADRLRDLDGRVIVLGAVRTAPLASMVPRDVDARLRAANQADRKAWESVKTKADWEQFRDKRLQALRESLGEFPPVPKDLKARVTGSFDGDGYHVDKIVFESRPGVIVTANLYRPTKPTASMPGMILCHSHQSSKHTAHRQDMAMTWARAGCLVLVPDHLGHGERRQHPFDDVPHDYQFRYDLGSQLHLIGDSLMGWFVWDLMRSVDFLLAQKGVDPKRLILISEPAGGGDVAAVAAAFEPRFTGVMVQNFGGPEPENAYPLTRDAEESFDYAGGGTWESTRNLRLTSRDGFMPWMIVAAGAPRKLIYFHEFYWDRDADPVWKRLQRVYGFYQAGDNLTGVSGKGFVVGSQPENSHWLAINREALYPTLERWFGIPNPKTEYSKRRPLEDFVCLTPEFRKELKVEPLHVLAGKIGEERTARARTSRQKMSPQQQREQLKKDWARLLGDVTPAADPVVKGWDSPPEKLGPVTVQRIHLGTEPGIVVPVLLLVPGHAKGAKVPVVVAVAQQGKQEFLRQREIEIADLLDAGVAVCLPDVRGTGETSPGAARDRNSIASTLTAGEWMLGQSLLGGRLRDLRSVVRHLRTIPGIDASRVALWGDSFTKLNPPGVDFKKPHADRPAAPEPLGGLLALLGALYEDDVRAVSIHGGLSDYQSALETPYCYLPLDVVVPGVLAVGDLTDTAATLAPRALRMERMVDGLNRAVADAELGRRYEGTNAAYAAANAGDRLVVGGGNRVAPWLIGQLQRK